MLAAWQNLEVIILYSNCPMWAPKASILGGIDKHHPECFMALEKAMGSMVLEKIMVECQEHLQVLEKTMQDLGKG